MANKRIKDLVTTKYKGFMALDDDEGTGKLYLHVLLNNFCGEFSLTRTYNGGDIVQYEASLYVCIGGHSGAWDPGSFVKTSVYEVLRIHEKVNGLKRIIPSGTTYDGYFINSDNLYDYDSHAHQRAFLLQPGCYRYVRSDDSSLLSLVTSLDNLLEGNLPKYVDGYPGRIITLANEVFTFELKTAAYFVKTTFGNQIADDCLFKDYKSHADCIGGTINAIFNDSFVLSYHQNDIRTRLIPVTPGQKVRVEPANAQSHAVCAFLQSSEIGGYGSSLTPSAYSPQRNDFWESVNLIVPPDAHYLAVLNDVNSTYTNPTIEVGELDNSRVSYTLETINAQLDTAYNLAMQYVIPGQTNTDHIFNLAKHLFENVYGSITYEVPAGYKLMVIATDSDFSGNAVLGPFTGTGVATVNKRYYRCEVMKSDNSVIVPEDGYEVTVTGGVDKLDTTTDKVELYPYGTDSDSEFVSGNDSLYAIQVLYDMAYCNGKRLILKKGKFSLRSFKQYNSANTVWECIFVSQEISPKQYTSTFHERSIEGEIKPCGYDGDDISIIELDDSAYNALNSSHFLKLFAALDYSQDWTTYFMTCFMKFKNLVIRVPNNQKKITAIDLSRTEGGSWLESVRIVGIPLDFDHTGTQDNFPSEAPEGSYGIMSNPGSTWNTNSNWKDVEVHGFHTGVYFAGMEHALVTNLTVQWCTYGMRFATNRQHPITLIAVQDEHNVHLPVYGDGDGAVIITGYNASWPEKAPGQPSSDAPGWATRKRATGNPRGRIEFTNNITQSGGIVGAVDYPAYFEKGHGIGCEVVNLHHKTMGTTTYMGQIEPNVGQKFFDTDLGKLLICTDIEPAVWSEA